MRGKPVITKARSRTLFFVAAVFLVVVMLAGADSASDGSGIGRRFHAQTCLTRGGPAGPDVHPPKPSQFKTYPDARKIDLPEPDYNGVSVEEALRSRRSIRSYSDKPLSLSQLSQLLFAAQGVTKRSAGNLYRAAPSAGATYPFEIYAVVNNVEDLPRGIYHYSVAGHGLELVKEGDFREAIAGAALGQRSVGEAGVTLVLTAVFDRTCHKYGQRGFRYVYIEAGAIIENLYLQAESLNLGSVCVGAFFDDRVNELLGIDGKKEAAICLQAAGNLP